MSEPSPFVLRPAGDEERKSSPDDEYATRNRMKEAMITTMPRFDWIKFMMELELLLLRVSSMDEPISKDLGADDDELPPSLSVGF